MFSAAFSYDIQGIFLNTKGILVYKIHFRNGGNNSSKVVFSYIVRH